MAQVNQTQQISDHPKLSYLGRPIKRYLQRVNNPVFGNDSISGLLSVRVEIKHYGVEDDNSETYLGASFCPDVRTSMEASNQNMVAVTGLDENNIPEIVRVEKDEDGNYPEGSMPEYDAWVAGLSAVPQGVTILDLIKSQMILFANRGAFDNY